MKNASFLNKFAALGLTLGALAIVGAGCPAWLSVQTNENAAVNARANGPTMVKEMTITMNATGASTQSGKALLVEEDNKTKVMVHLDGAPAGSTEPAHIHVGACPTPGEVKYSLNALVDGKSVTELNVKFDDLVAGLPLALNVHKSAAEIGVYEACGNLRASSVTEKVAGSESLMMDESAVMESHSGTSGSINANVNVNVNAHGSY